MFCLGGNEVVEGLTGIKMLNPIYRRGTISLDNGVAKIFRVDVIENERYYSSIVQFCKRLYSCRLPT